MCFSRKFRLLYTISTIWFQYTHFICTVIYLYSDPYACFSLGFLLIFFQLATHVWIHPCLLAFVRQRQKSKRLPQSVLMPAWRALSLIYGRWRLLVHNVPAWRYRLIGQLSKSVVNYSCGFSYIKYILHQNEMKILSFAIYTVFPLYMELALGLALGSVKYQTEVGCTLYLGEWRNGRRSHLSAIHTKIRSLRGRRTDGRKLAPVCVWRHTAWTTCVAQFISNEILAAVYDFVLFISWFLTLEKNWYVLNRYIIFVAFKDPNTKSESFLKMYLIKCKTRLHAIVKL